jgi:hypothetical protein
MNWFPTFTMRKESKTAGQVAPAVEYIRTNDSNRHFFPPERGALKIEFLDELWQFFIVLCLLS